MRKYTLKAGELSPSEVKPLAKNQQFKKENKHLLASLKMKEYYNYSIYKKVLIEFNNLKIKYNPSKQLNNYVLLINLFNKVKIPAFKRPTLGEIKEFAREGRYFNYYKKGYISN
ncbi:hypothetical protein B0T13DRAFT_448909 [Neurospora crassa]|nr:hypothetical protein B0T13DRAFT_448909 [Neurospora crassa]